MRRAGGGRWPICFAAVLVGVGALQVTAALQWRNPGIVARWPVPQTAFACIAACTFVVAAWIARPSLFVGIVAAALPLAALVITASAQHRASVLRSSLFALSQEDLREAASHVIAGFYDMDEARALARAGVAGLFLSARNVRARTIEEIAADVADLQALRHAAGLPPLWIAADQEGGFVANLSPPLPRPAPLAVVAADDRAIAAEADNVGRQLAAIGVNVNFAPVVDVTRGHIDPKDRNSRIALRSLSSDPAVVIQAAGTYCRVLATRAVRCTIKHLPGLGDVTADTHVATAHRATIDARDLAPFRRLTAADGPQLWVMLSHLVVDDKDPAAPASASPALIGMLRHDLAYDGLLVTDDAAMAPYHARLAANAVSTLKSGGDLILASWNPDVAFDVIAILGEAAGKDRSLADALKASDARLTRSRASETLPGR